MADVIVVIGAGLIGRAIARRVGAGKVVLLADLRRENAEAAGKGLGEAGFDASVAPEDAPVDFSLRAGCSGAHVYYQPQVRVVAIGGEDR